jgi:hypothetical protein
LSVTHLQKRGKSKTPGRDTLPTNDPILRSAYGYPNPRTIGKELLD